MNDAATERRGLDARSLTIGKRYVVMITGVVRPVVTECVDTDDPHYHKAQLKVLNGGVFADVVLRGDDYILMEEYDVAKHGIVEGVDKPTKLTRWEQFVAWCKRWRKQP